MVPMPGWWVVAGRGVMAVYFTNVGPKKGPYLYQDARGAAIGVL